MKFLNHSDESPGVFSETSINSRLKNIIISFVQKMYFFLFIASPLISIRFYLSQHPIGPRCSRHDLTKMLLAVLCFASA